MRRGQQRPDGGQVPGMQQLRGCQYPRVLGDHLPGPAAQHRAGENPRTRRGPSAMYSTQVQQRRRPGTPPTSHRQPASCPNDCERPRCQECASRAWYWYAAQAASVQPAFLCRPPSASIWVLLLQPFGLAKPSVPECRGEAVYSDERATDHQCSGLHPEHGTAEPDD